MIEYDSSTDTLLLAVLDGHGEQGDRCSLWWVVLVALVDSSTRPNIGGMGGGVVVGQALF